MMSIADSVNLVVFTIIYLFICNWFQVQIFFFALTKPKTRISIITDPWISNIMRKKAGLYLKRIVIFETGRPFGMMPSIPWKPEMILSRGLYENFNKDELEWVILHEAAHCVLWHNVKLAIAQILILSTGGFLILYFHSIILAPVIGSLLALIFIRFAKYTEYEADYFSISRVDNPRGVITAQDKFMRIGKKYGYSPDESFFRRYILWNILFSERVTMAKARM